MPLVVFIYNVCQLYSAECVFKIKSILGMIFYAISGAVRFKRIHPLAMMVKTFVLFLLYYIGSMNHKSLFGVRSPSIGM